MYGVCLKNYSRQKADDHEYLLGLDWKLTVLNQRSVQINTTALLTLRWSLNHTILKALTLKSHLFYPECKLFGFNRKKFSNVDIVLPLVVFQCTLTAKVRVLWLQRISKPNV